MIISSENELHKVIELLDKSDCWSYDIESNGLDVRNGQIIGVSGASDAGSFYIIHKAWNGSELVEMISKQALQQVIQAFQTKKLITHNGSFDARFTYHYFGIKLWPSLYHDTQLAAHTENENRFNYKLKDLGVEFFGETAKKEQTAMEESIKTNGGAEKEMFKADAQKLAEYGRKDAELTWNLHKILKKELEKQGLSKFFHDEEVMPLYKNVTIKMELEGIPIDMQALENAKIEINTDMLKLEDEIQEQIKPLLGNFHDWFIDRHYPFKFTPQFKNKLGDKLGASNWPKTKSGGLSFSKSDIERAIKKGLIDANCKFYRVAMQLEKPERTLVREIQLELLAEEGTKYVFNLLSADHLKRLFFKAHDAHLDEQPLSRTPKGAPQINDEFLEVMSSKYTWASQLQTYRSLSKLRGTYIEGTIKRSENGIFYPQFLQHRTTSGRYSGDAQQMPRIKTEEDIPNEMVRKHNNKVRNFFVSAPGWKLVDADYSSLEVVVFADDAQDEALLDIIRKDYDFYSQVAIEVNKLTEYSADKKAHNFLKKHKPELRQWAKAYALGIRYGESAYKLHKELNCSQGEAEQIVKSYYETFPRLKQRMDELIKRAKTEGQIKSKAGRIRHLGDLKRLHDRYGDVLGNSLELWKEYNETPGTYADMKKKARVYKNLVNNSLNYPIQSMAASIVSRASIAIMKYFEQHNMKSYIALSVHDELCIHSPEHEVEEVARVMQDLMENTTKLSVPLSAEPIIGTRYGEVK